MNGVEQFWNTEFEELAANGAYTLFGDATLRRAAAFFGDMRGKSVLDIGCGLGATSVAFAKLGAKVTAIDVSSVAIGELHTASAADGLAITAHVHNAMDIERLGTFDFVIGSMILHHLEPFDRFADALANVLKPGGKAFFFENNSASRLLVWFRENLVGKLWIPKYGDQDEFPLKPQEIDMLKRRLMVTQEFPSLVFFALIPVYFFKGRGSGLFKAIDALCYRVGALRKYSYQQYVLIEKPAQATAVDDVRFSTRP